MADEYKQQEESVDGTIKFPGVQASGPGEAVQGGGGDSGIGGVGPGEGDTQQQIEVMGNEINDLKQRLLRVAADYQNYARRSGQAVEDGRRQEKVEMLRSLLPVLDHFDRALEMKTVSAEAGAVLTGMKMVRDEFLKALEGVGMKRVEAKAGEVFDPAKHEAMMRQSVEGMEANHVAQQLAVGYVLGELTLRPAKVSVTA